MKPASAIKKLLPGATTIRQAAVLFSGNVLSLTITAVGYPILTRLYGDLEFGNFMLFQSIVVILMRVTSLNYNRALVIAPGENRFRNLLSLSLALNLVFSLLVLLLVLGSVPKAIGIDLDFQHAIWIPLSVFLGGMAETCLYAFNRLQQYRNISLLKVTDRAGFQASGIGFGWANLAFNGLIAGHIVGQVLSLGAAAVKVFSRLPKRWCYQYSKQTLIRFIDFPAHSLPAVVLEQISRYLPIFIIAWYIDKETTGQYGLAYRMLSLPETLIGAGIAQIFYQQLNDKYQQRLSVKTYIFRIWGVLLLLGALPFASILLFGELLFEFAFGSQWNQAGEIAQTLSPMIFLMFVSTPTSQTFTVFRRQKISLAFSVSILMTRSLSFILGLMVWDLFTALTMFVVSEIGMMILFNYWLLKVVSQWESQRNL